MCNTFVCTSGVILGLNYKLILLNNRDERLDRKTSAAHWEQGYLAGHDEQEKERGIWLGIRRDGHIGNTLSITEPDHVKMQRTAAPTRGTIATNFLVSSQPAFDFCQDFKEQSKEYNGFQFLSLERNVKDAYEITSLTNRLVKEVEPRRWPAGIYCFGNSPYDRPMRKVIYGEQIFRKFINELAPDAKEQEIVEGLMRIAQDKSDQTGRDDTYNRPLSAIYVQFPPEVRYGTRCHTIILVDKWNQVYFRETRMQDDLSHNSVNAEWETSEFRFSLE